MKVAVLLSGTGRTLENLIKHDVKIDLVISNKQDVRGNLIAQNNRIKLEITNSNEYIFELLRNHNIGLVCLAGFLKKLSIPPDFNNKVMNIHPSLLPAFGGKGMYGHHVHEAVLKVGCKVSGCTVHFVDNEYDHGPIILQRVVPVSEDETADSLAQKVFTEECRAYPQAIFQFLYGYLEVLSGRVRLKR